ncbi:hypothetical protein GUJ93_ZPchr0009g2436 [Zizania palustris]|uniref:Uncharacterized protein n=1 Tax=Zizania palustris TaxID=103762 RepID=A0A8J5RR76_ZIZPA|nr:hypothetical protein GUJ93_ZPchr0009g2436 [Zizania palustris]
MVGIGAGLGMEATSCGALLSELQQIWAEVGESEGEKNKVLSEIERECLQVYRRKVDDANQTRVQLHQSVATKEAEVASLIAALGEHKLYFKKDKCVVPLKEQLAAVVPLLEKLQGKKEERIKLFSGVQSQIEKISSELSEYSTHDDSANSLVIDENDLSTRKLNSYQAELRALQKESLHQNGLEQSTNISNSTLENLARTISNLKAERKSRINKMRETMESLCQLWKLMDSTEEERKQFNKLMSMEAEVERITKLKASRLKEIFMEKRLELEEICKNAHIEPDASTAPEHTNAMIDSGIIDPSELLANIESQILKAKEESLSRKDIMDRINKWITACDEEAWLEEYNQDSKRYSAGRGAHIHLRRAEKARILVTKIPAMVDNLINRTFAWENARNKPLLYDGGRLVSVLEEYRLNREQKEEEKRRYRDQKKLESILLKEKEAIFGSKPSPKRTISLNRGTNGIPFARMNLGLTVKYLVSLPNNQH